MKWNPSKIHQLNSRNVSLGEYDYHLQVQDPACCGGSHDTGEDVPGEVSAAELVTTYTLQPTLSSAHQQQCCRYTQLLPGKEAEEEGVAEGAELEQEAEEDDGYTPPQEDYLPPGLQVRRPVSWDFKLTNKIITGTRGQSQQRRLHRAERERGSQ